MTRKKVKAPPLLGPGQCNLCERHSKTQNICIPGYGPKKPKLIVIAESPARTEDSWCRNCTKPKAMSCAEKGHVIGQPLVGQAGQLLRQALREVGYNPDTEVYMSNIVKCSGGNPNMKEIRRCRNYLVEELAGLDYSECKGLMLLGTDALKGFFNDGLLSLRDHRLRVLDASTPRGPGGAPVPEISLPEGRGASQINDQQRTPTRTTPLIPHGVPIRATFHPASALPGRSPENYDELICDLENMVKQRDLVKSVKRIETQDELDEVFAGERTLAIDLEWSGAGRIRCVGLSDGKTNAVAQADLAMEWLREAIHSHTKRV